MLCDKANSWTEKEINIWHAELGHPSEVITWATGWDMGYHITVTFRPCEDCVLGYAKKVVLHKKTVEHSKVLGERLFFNISSQLTPTYGGNKH